MNIPDWVASAIAPVAAGLCAATVAYGATQAQIETTASKVGQAVTAIESVEARVRACEQAQSATATDMQWIREAITDVRDDLKDIKTTLRE